MSSFATSTSHTLLPGRLLRVLWPLCLLLIAAPGCRRRHTAPPIAVAAPSADTANPTPGNLEAQLDRLAGDLVRGLEQEAPQGVKRRLAISEFVTLRGQETELGRYIAEELATRMIRSGKAQVVERKLLQKVMDEQTIGASELVDDDTAARIGKLLGADTLCLGTITDLGHEVKVNARLTRANTAEVFWSSRVSLESDSVAALLGRPSNRPSASKPAPVVAPSTANTLAAAAVFLHRPMGKITPLTLQLRNRTKWCLAITLNGVARKIFEDTQEVHCVPPNERAFVELTQAGETSLSITGATMTSPTQPLVRYVASHFFREEKRGSLLIIEDELFSAVR